MDTKTEHKGGAMEYKAVPLELKAASGDEGLVEGYFSVFSNLDDGGDIMMPGAFDKTLQENGKRIKVLYQHDAMKLIGPAPMELHPDSKGLYAKTRLTISRNGQRGSFWADEAWALMKDGALTEGSIGYQSIPARTDYNQNGTRALHEVKLWEISPVPWGMNALTELRAVKALAVGDEVETYMRVLGTLTTELKAGRVLSASNLDKVTAVQNAMTELMDILQELIDAAAPAPDKEGHPAPLDTKAIVVSLQQRKQLEKRLQLLLLN